MDWFLQVGQNGRQRGAAILPIERCFSVDAFENMSSETQRIATPAALDRWVSLYLFSSTVHGTSKFYVEPKGSWAFTALPNLRGHFCFYYRTHVKQVDFFTEEYQNRQSIADCQLPFFQEYQNRQPIADSRQPRKKVAFFPSLQYTIYDRFP